jgi:hypothetical protein
MCKIHSETCLKVSLIGPDGDIKEAKFLKIGQEYPLHRPFVITIGDSLGNRFCFGEPGSGRLGLDINLGRALDLE